MSKPLLALESSTAVGSVAVGDADGVRAEMTLNVVGSHSSALLPAVDRVMEAAGVEPGELGGVVVGAGPGSFTGLRIAAATAKGIVHGLDLPLFAYSSLLAAAAAGWGSGRPVCALFDARRRDVFAGCWEFAAEGTGGTAFRALLEATAMDLDELIERMRGDRPPLFVGDGAALHRSEIARELGAAVLPQALEAPRASALLWLAGHAPESGRVPDPGAWEPDYVRDPGAVRIAAARSGAAGAP